MRLFELFTRRPDVFTSGGVGTEDLPPRYDYGYYLVKSRQDLTEKVELTRFIAQLPDLTFWPWSNKIVVRELKTNSLVLGRLDDDFNYRFADATDLIAIQHGTVHDSALRATIEAQFLETEKEPIPKRILELNQ